MKNTNASNFQTSGPSQGFSRFSFFSLCYTVFVILWGAFVRATGSGAGCGAHWPKCDGQIIPRELDTQMMIEFFHRATSGLALIFVAILFFWARKNYLAHSSVRRFARLSLIFIVIEALIGALIVLMRWVEYDQSMARVISIALHLVNTLFLVAAQTLTWRAAQLGRADFQFESLSLAKPEWLKRAVLGLSIGFFIVGGTGAWAALGDTLFPVETLREGLDQHFTPRAHFLIHLRVLHPVSAVLTALGMLAFSMSMISQGGRSQGLARLLAAWVITNVLLGIINVVLLAPVWMQIVHLLVANLIWILFVSLVSEQLKSRSAV